MKHFILILLFFFFNLNAYALNCLPEKMSVEVFSKLDLIVKGSVSVQERSKSGGQSSRLLVDIKKAWKGAKKGEKVTVFYLNTSGIPYQSGKDYIIYAEKKNNKFITHGCMFYNFDMYMSPELRDYVTNPPYIDKSKPIPPEIKKMKYLLSIHEEVVLDKLAGAVFDKPEEQIENQYKTHCDCVYIAGSFKGSKHEVGERCIKILRELHDSGLGAIGVLCERGSCTCMLSHSVYGFGEDQDSALRNAEITCENVAKKTSKDFKIKSRDECKKQQ